MKDVVVVVITTDTIKIEQKYLEDSKARLIPEL